PRKFWFSQFYPLPSQKRSCSTHFFWLGRKNRGRIRRRSAPCELRACLCIVWHCWDNERRRAKRRDRQDLRGGLVSFGRSNYQLLYCLHSIAAIGLYAGCQNAGRTETTNRTE